MYFQLSLFHINCSMYCPAELHVSAVQGRNQVHCKSLTNIKKIRQF
jgi:hypothetical protein